MFVEAKNLNEALVLLSKKLNENGVMVERRGFKCLEYPGAVLLCIENPIDRYVNIPQRKWNKTLGWIESLWIARGDNSLDMPVSYVKNLVNFSDDGKYMRAGYGPRIRRYGDNNSYIGSGVNTLSRQYKNGKTNEGGRLKEPSKYQNVTDQLRFVIEKFKEDIQTREAVITIHDPVADDFNGVGADFSSPLLKTKDTPCTRSIHFMIVDGKMNCYVDMRSNDLIWGLSAVNVFNFTLMQEYVAAIVGVPVGKYYHKADNLHVYEDFIPMIKEISDIVIDDYTSLFSGYTPTYKTLEEFDNLVKELTGFEEACRNHWELSKDSLNEFISDRLKNDSLFSDWAKVIYRYWYKEKVVFTNPYLNELFK